MKREGSAYKDFPWTEISEMERRCEYTSSLCSGTASDTAKNTSLLVLRSVWILHHGT